MTQYPEHEKMKAVADASQAIGEFLDGTEYVLARYEERSGYNDAVLVPVSGSINQILAEYFDIDLNKIEDEKRAMLAALAEANQ